MEQTIQFQRTTPATEASASQAPTGAPASVEQAFTHEVEHLREEWERAIGGQCKLLEFFEQKQKSMDKQLAGLKSFAEHVEKFLEQYTRSGGATAPSGHSELGSSVRERHTTATGQTPGPPSSPTRMFRCLCHQRFQFHLFPATLRHHLTLNHLVHQRWSAGDTAILRNQEAK